MVGRRQLREKVVESVYSYLQNPVSPQVLLKNMMTQIGKIYDLYVYELNFLLVLKELEEEQIEIAGKKFLKTQEDTHPNLKFVENSVLRALEENEERIAYTSKNSQLRWETTDEMALKTYKRIRAGKRYQEYMASQENSFAEDQKFIGKLFLRYVAENDDLQDVFEDEELSWADDAHIANSLVQRTISFLREGEHQEKLIPIFKDGEDEVFVKTLLTKTVHNEEALTAKIEDRLQNWELSRISTIDRAILLTALSEMDEFKLIPTNVIINEYIEISKAFSNEKSNIFVNGILDKYAKDTSRV